MIGLERFSLTDEQADIARHDGDAFINACPGAGKTRAVVALAARVSAELLPSQGVALLSYTNAAVDEFRERTTAFGVSHLTRHPNFVGTMDAFVFRYLVGPAGSPWAPTKPVRPLDSWQGYKFGFPTGQRTANGKAEFRSASLDSFRAGSDGQLAIDPQLSQHKRQKLLGGLSAKGQDNMLRAAREEHRRLLRRGLLAADDARLLAGRYLRSSGSAIGRALAARFRLLVLDEAQDCNQRDLQIVQSLRSAGIACVLVADIEQAIFRWRDAAPAELRQSVDGWTERPLTGNFRSTPNICKAASSLRSVRRLDRSVGSLSGDETPVIVIPYSASQPTGAAIAFGHHLRTFDIGIEESITLAHQLEAARLVAGHDEEASPSTDLTRASLGRISALVAGSALDGRTYRQLTQRLAAILLKAAGADEVDREVPHLLRTWSWTTARQLLGVLSNANESDHAPLLRNILRRLCCPTGAPLHFPQVRDIPRRSIVSPALRVSTVHRAKGREFQAVLLVIPENTFLESTLSAWDLRSEDESRSVLYVGATRAKRLLAFAVPSAYSATVACLLRRDGAAVLMHDES